VEGHVKVVGQRPAGHGGGITRKVVAITPYVTSTNRRFGV
jgi:hypothetical protein